MALCESYNRRISTQNPLPKIVVFISANTSGAGDKTAKHYNKAIQSHYKESKSQHKPF